MANIVITYTTNSILVEFNMYSTLLDMTKGCWNKNHINSIVLRANDIVVSIDSNHDWTVSFNGSSDTFQIDSIDGSVPTNNSDLYDKLKKPNIIK